MDERLERIRDRIALLAAVDEERQVFGADTHGWQLAAPLSGDELGDLERRLGVALPDEVRKFLRSIGAGGAGPFSGLLPFDAVTGDVIRIADQGCAMSSLLIVRGEHAGEVWTDMGERRAPEAPSFLAWYEGWIERALIEWSETAAARLVLDGERRTEEIEAATLAFELLEPLRDRTHGEERALGYLYLRERRAGEASSAFERALKAREPSQELLRSEREARLRRDRAVVAYVLEDPATAIQHCRAGLAIKNIWFSTSDELRDVLERSLRANGDEDAALEILEERAAGAYFDFEVHHRLAHALIARNDVKGAIKALERAACMPNIGEVGASFDARVSGSFQPIVETLRARGRTREAEALVAHADMLVNGN